MCLLSLALTRIFWNTDILVPRFKRNEEFKKMTQEQEQEIKNKEGKFWWAIHQWLERRNINIWDITHFVEDKIVYPMFLYNRCVIRIPVVNLYKPSNCRVWKSFLHYMVIAFTAVFFMWGFLRLTGYLINITLCHSLDNPKMNVRKRLFKYYMVNFIGGTVATIYFFSSNEFWVYLKEKYGITFLNIIKQIMSDQIINITTSIAIIALVLAALSYLKSVVIRGLQNKYINRVPFDKNDPENEQKLKDDDASVRSIKKWVIIYSISMVVLSTIPPILLFLITQQTGFTGLNWIFQTIIWILLLVGCGLLVALIKYEKDKWFKFEEKFDAVIENKRLQKENELKFLSKAIIDGLFEGFLNIKIEGILEEKKINITVQKKIPKD